MLLSPRFRDLSREFGAAVETPGQFYPQTTEEPNHTKDHYNDFMSAVIHAAHHSGVVLQSREHYMPGPTGMGGGVAYVGELLQFSTDHWQSIVSGLSLVGLFFPEQFKSAGTKMTSAVAAIRFSHAWHEIAAKQHLAVRRPWFLQPTVEGLCLLDALSSRSAGDAEFRISSVEVAANTYSSARRPAGSERYKVTIQSNTAVYTYLVSGSGQGMREIRGRVFRRDAATNVDLLATKVDVVRGPV